MRILQVAPPWYEVPPRAYGGTELVVAALADGLSDAGHEVTLLASGNAHTRAATHRAVYAVPPTDDMGDLVTELLHVMGVDELGSFDVVHDHTLLGTARLTARGVHPLVHTLHSAWTHRSRSVYRQLAADVSLVAISHDQASRAEGVPLAATIAHGVDTARYPLALDHTDELAFVGRADPAKGPELAVEVARRTGRPLTMAIRVGSPDEQAYWDEVVQPRLRGVDALVVLDATQEEKVALLSRAHAVVVPLQWDEPFGLVMAEAAACGTPVVAFDRGAANEVVANGRTGILVPPGEGVEGLCRAVADVPEIDRATCRDHAVASLSADRMVAAHLELYARLTLPRFQRTRPPELAPPFVPPHVRPPSHVTG